MCARAIIYLYPTTEVYIIINTNSLYNQNLLVL